jgi:hypothetical protein
VYVTQIVIAVLAGFLAIGRATSVHAQTATPGQFLDYAVSKLNAVVVGRRAEFASRGTNIPAERGLGPRMLTARSDYGGCRRTSLNESRV